MAHMWNRFKRGVAVAGKAAGVVGTAALAAHAIHKGMSLHNDLNDRRGWEPVNIEHHGVAKNVRF
jgi:hypothetical protein